MMLVKWRPLSASTTVPRELAGATLCHKARATRRDQAISV